MTGLDQTEQIQLIEAALRGPDTESLCQLCQRFYKLQIVHKHARQKVASLTAVDKIEVFLKFEIALVQALTRLLVRAACSMKAALAALLEMTYLSANKQRSKLLIILKS